MQRYIPKKSKPKRNKPKWANRKPEVNTQKENKSFTFKKFKYNNKKTVKSSEYFKHAKAYTPKVKNLKIKLH